MLKLSAHVGAKIRIFRKNRGFTQEQLGEKVQQPQSYVGAIERGEKNISLDTLERIVEALNIRPSELFNSYNELQSKDQLEKERLIDYLTYLLQDRNLSEVATVTRLIEDVLRAYDAK